MEMPRFFELVFFMSIITFTSAGKETFDNGNYIVEWMVIPASQEIEFNITAKTIGWVGLGITEIRKDMEKLDVIVGGVDNSRSYLWDMYADGLGPPRKDAKQDVTRFSGSEKNGITVIFFRRKLNTGDTANDNEIKVDQSYYLAWAYHKNTDVSTDLSTFPKHTSKGYSARKIMLAQASDFRTSPPITATKRPTSTVSGATSIITTKITPQSTTTVATPTTTASAFSPSILFLAVTTVVTHVLNYI